MELKKKNGSFKILIFVGQNLETGSHFNTSPSWSQWVFERV